MILNEIKEKLLEVDPVVFYGMFDKNYNAPVLDYIVFDRKKININTNKNSYSYYFSVHIIRENFIPEGFEKIVIDKVCEIPGMRVADEPPVFDYTTKPNTNVVMEMLSIDFVRPVKV